VPLQTLERLTGVIEVQLVLDQVANVGTAVALLVHPGLVDGLDAGLRPTDRLSTGGDRSVALDLVGKLLDPLVVALDLGVLEGHIRGELAELGILFVGEVLTGLLLGKVHNGLALREERLALLSSCLAPGDQPLQTLIHERSPSWGSEIGQDQPVPGC